MKRYVFNVDPVGAVRMVRSDKWKRRPAVMRYWYYRDCLRAEASRLKFEPVNDMEFKFYLPMPASWSGKKKDRMINKRHEQKPDFDNLVKGFFDALMDEDCKISGVSGIYKFWGKTGKIEVLI